MGDLDSSQWLSRAERCYEEDLVGFHLNIKSKPEELLLIPLPSSIGGLYR